MADRKWVIAQLVADMDIAKLTGESLVHITRETAMNALALLREQEPVKPKRFLGALPDWYHCGVCGADMLDIGDGYRPKYCPQCGRAVKWDG